MLLHLIRQTAAEPPHPPSSLSNEELVVCLKAKADYHRGARGNIRGLVFAGKVGQSDQGRVHCTGIAYQVYRAPWYNGTRYYI